VGRLLLYDLRLAARSLRRNLKLSAAIFACLALATSLWATVSEHYVRVYGPSPSLGEALHQVELPHPIALSRAASQTNAEPNTWGARTRVTFPEYQALASTDIPTRQMASIRARVLVADAAGATSVACARFTDPAFFSLFPVPVRGRGFTDAEQAAGEPVAVLGWRLAEALAGGLRALGATVLVEGQPFRVVGVVEDDQPYRPTWDVAMTGGLQDALYLPTPWFRRLLARPETVVYQSPVGRSYEDLLASDAVFVSFWIELPTAERRAAYDRFLADHFGSRGIPYVLRSFPAWRKEFPVPVTDVAFFVLLAELVLLGAGFNMARLLVAKGLARAEELGIHRALGARRRSLFLRMMLEAALLSVPAACAGVAISLVFHAVFNRVVAPNDIPIGVTRLGLAISLGSALFTGLVAALYPAWRVAHTPPTVYLGRS